MPNLSLTIAQITMNICLARYGMAILIFQQDFSDSPNYLMPSVIADHLACNEVDICFNAPDVFSLNEVRNMHAFGLCDTGFISFNPADSSVCIVYADGFIERIANSFDEFILSLHE